MKSRVVTVKGKRGTLKKSFKHMSVEMKKLSEKKLRIDMWFTTRKQAAYMKTVVGHIKNMFKGVTYGYLYKMRAVYAHFPINIATSEEDTLVEIRNFLGEKYTRAVRMRSGVTCKSTGVKDEIKVEGNDLELVSQSGRFCWYNAFCSFSCSYWYILSPSPFSCSHPPGSTGKEKGYSEVFGWNLCFRESHSRPYGRMRLVFFVTVFNVPCQCSFAWLKI